MISVIEDKPLIDNISDYDVILVGTNCYQVMRNGFQYDIAKKLPYVKEMNNSTKYGDPSKVGTILECNGRPLVTLIYKSRIPSIARNASAMLTLLFALSSSVLSNH